MLISGRTVVLNGLKKEIEYMTHTILHRIVKIKSYQREVTGVIGKTQEQLDSENEANSTAAYVNAQEEAAYEQHGGGFFRENGRY